MNTRQVVLLCVVAATRGSSFLFVALALKSFGPFVIVFAQFLLATLTLGSAALITGELATALSDLWHRPALTLTFGLTQAVLPFLLITLGQQVISSGLAAILLATAPLFVAMLAPVLDKSERMHLSQLGGLLAGLLGVALVVGGGQITAFAQVLGIGAIIVAAASYAFSGFIMKRAYRASSPIAATLLAFLIGIPLLLPFAIFSHGQAQLSGQSILTLVTLGVLNTALPLTAYIQLVREVGAGRALLMTYLSPVVALLLAAIFLHEQITIKAVVGLIFILGGITVVVRQPLTLPLPIRQK